MPIYSKWRSGKTAKGAQRRQRSDRVRNSIKHPRPYRTLNRYGANMYTKAFKRKKPS